MWLPSASNAETGAPSPTHAEQKQQSRENSHFQYRPSATSCLLPFQVRSRHYRKQDILVFIDISWFNVSFTHYCLLLPFLWTQTQLSLLSKGLGIRGHCMAARWTWRSQFTVSNSENKQQQGDARESSGSLLKPSVKSTTETVQMDGEGKAFLWSCLSERVVKSCINQGFKWCNWQTSILENAFCNYLHQLPLPYFKVYSSNYSLQLL